MKILTITDQVNDKVAVIGIHSEGKDKAHTDLCERVVKRTLKALINLGQLPEDHEITIATVIENEL